MSDDEDYRTIWCGNLPENITHDVFYELFLQAGPLEKVRIPKDGEGRQRNFGFITYVHRESVPYAIDLFKGTVLYERSLTMRMQKPPETPRHETRITGNYPDFSPLPGYPTPDDMSQMDPNMMKFMAMSNQMMCGMPTMNNYPYNDYPENFGSYDNQHGNTNKLTAASLQGQWSSRSKDRSDRRHEPYSSRSREEWRGRDRGRDRDREDNRDRNNSDQRDRDHRDDYRDNHRGNYRGQNDNRQRNRRNR